MAHSNVTPVIGLPQFTGWSQISESVHTADGQLVCVFAVSGQHAGSVGRDVAAKITDYTTSNGADLMIFLEELVSFVARMECFLSFACMAQLNNTTLFATFSGFVFLKRGLKTGVITSSEQEISVIQGKYLPDDVVILATGAAYAYVHEIQQKFAQGYDVDSIITSIVPSIHSQEDSSLCALGFLMHSAQGVAAAQPPVKAPLEGAAPIPVVQEEELPKYKGIPPELESAKSLAKNRRAYVMSVLQFLFSVLWLITIGLLQKIFQSIIKISQLTRNGRSLDSLAKNKFSVFKLAIVLVLLAAVVAGAVWYNWQQKIEQERITGLLQPLIEKRVTGQEMLEQDPIAARELLAETVSQLEMLEKQEAQSKAAPLILTEKTATQQILDEHTPVQEIDQLSILYDLRSVTTDFIASAIAISNDMLLVLDKEQKRTVFIDIAEKQPRLTNLSQQSKTTAIAFKNNQVVLLADGLYTYTPETFESPEEIKPEGESNKEGKFVASYDRFIYVLNPIKRNIYRYAASDSGYSDPIGWVVGVSGIEYVTITSLSVDSAIWLTTAAGDIKKLVSGREESFVVRGIDPFQSSIVLYTDENLEHLYVLEPKLSRVVVLKKNGDFVTEVRSSVLASATGLVASETMQKVFVSSGSLLFEFSTEGL